MFPTLRRYLRQTVHAGDARVMGDRAVEERGDQTAGQNDAEAGSGYPLPAQPIAVRRYRWMSGESIVTTKRNRIMTAPA